MFYEYGVHEQIYDALKSTVPLPTGGYIVMEHTEAMTVVDVNTGSYVGEDNLESTVFKVNLAATEEIARQVRLRNVGGIVSVDFIDMADEAHKEAVTEALKKHLERDRAKCRVLPMSDLCVTLFTRKRQGSMIQRYLIKNCPHCGGKGYVHDDLFVIASLRAEILDIFADGYKAAIVELNEHILKKILREGLFSRECKGRWKDKRVYMVPHKTFKEDQYTVRGDNAKTLTLPDKAQLLY
jgi:ribonuclease G